jgi:hypothetical protein
MWRHFQQAKLFCIFLHNMPDDFFWYSFIPGRSSSANTAKYSSACDFSRNHPVVPDFFDPIRNRNSLDVASFPNQIDDGPVILAALKMIDGQFDKLTAAAAASQQDRKNRPIAFSHERFGLRKLPKQTSFWGRQPVAKPADSARR